MQIIKYIADNTTNSRFTRAGGFIRQYTRSLIRFAHSPARSLTTHIASRLYYCSALQASPFQLCRHDTTYTRLKKFSTDYVDILEYTHRQD